MTYSRFNKRRAARGVIVTRGSEGNAEKFWRKMTRCQFRRWRISVWDGDRIRSHSEIIGAKRGLARRFKHWEAMTDKFSIRSGELRRRFTFTIHDCPF